MRAKFGHDISSSLAAYTWQTLRQTDRHTELYRFKSVSVNAAMDNDNTATSVCLSVCMYPSFLDTTVGPQANLAHIQIDMGLIRTLKKWPHVWFGRLGSLGPISKIGLGRREQGIWLITVLTDENFVNMAVIRLVCFLQGPGHVRMVEEFGDEHGRHRRRDHHSRCCPLHGNAAAAVHHSDRFGEPVTGSSGEFEFETIFIKYSLCVVLKQLWEWMK